MEEEERKALAERQKLLDESAIIDERNQLLQQDKQPDSSNTPEQTDMTTRATVREQSESQAETEVEVEDDGSGIIDGIADVAQGVARGTQRGIDATVELAEDGANAMVSSVGERPQGPNTPAATNDGDVDFQNTSEAFGSIPEPDSTAGKLASGLSQFAVGMFGGGKFLKAANWAKSSKPFVRSMVQGGIADFTAFQENEARLSNMVEDYAPELSNPMTRYLAADEDDGFFEGRLKNTIEGAGLGAAGDMLFRTAKFLKKGKQNAQKLSKEEAVALNERGAKEVADFNDQMVDSVTGRDPRMNNSPLRPEQRNTPTMTDAERNAVLDEAQVIRSEEYADQVVLNDPAEVTQAKQLFRMAEDGKISTDEALRFVPFRRPEKFNKFGDYVSAYSDRIGKIFEERGAAEMGEPQSARELITLAEQNMSDPDQVLRNLEEFAGQKDDVAPLVFAGRALYEGAEQDVINSVQAWKNGTGSQQRAMKAIDFMGRVQQALRGTATTAGRSLNVHKLSTDEGAAMNADEIARTIDRREIYGSEEEFLEKISTIKEPGTAGRVIRASFAEKAWELHNEIWLNSLLAGPKTQIINQASNALQAVVAPIETAAGSIVRRDFRTSRAAASQAAGLAQYSLDALKYAGKSAYNEDAFLDPFTANNMGHLPTEGVGNNKVTSQAFGRLGEMAGGGANRATGQAGRKVGEAAGGVVRLPTRGLMAGDEFWKQLNYRARLKSQAVDEAARKGLSTKKTIERPDGTMISEAEEYIATRFQQGFDEAGAAVDDRALQYAREQTFTNDLLPGTIGRTVQEQVNKHPSLRLVMPFVRTPTNLFRQAWQRTPGINLLQKEYRQALRSSDDMVRSQAYGKMMTGAAVWSLGSQLALNGHITGEGPMDPDMRQKLLSQGWKPYSFTDGETYYQFDRADPLGMIFGIIGDWAEAGAELDDKQVEELSMGGVLSIGEAMFGDQGMTAEEKTQMVGSMVTTVPKNLMNKTYMKSLTDVLTTLTDGKPDAAGRLLKQRIASYVPNNFSQQRRATDPRVLEMRTVMDQVKGSIPGLAKDVEARRDVFGNPVMRSGSALNRLLSPVAISQRKDDPVVETMIDLGGAYPAVPDTRGNLDLTQFTNKNGRTAWAIWNDYVQKNDLHSKLEELVTSDGFQNLSEGTSSVEQDYPGTKSFALNKVINQTQKMAYQQMLQSEGGNLTSENGMTFLEAYRNEERNKALSKQGYPEDQLLPIK